MRLPEPYVNHDPAPNILQYTAAAVYVTLCIIALAVAGAGAPSALERFGVGLFCSLVIGCSATCWRQLRHQGPAAVPGSLPNKVLVLLLYCSIGIIALPLALGHSVGAFHLHASLGISLGGYVYLRCMGPVLEWIDTRALVRAAAA
ncbi:hypothetical protein C3942_18125 [Solimonas fluminis]|uniref:Transmembrane protein n=1 Tax=Solimonas fluminis TaxID=2086571 RepID=A0A2S5TBZ1_9GAMM|nr:hypothetical protein C3942_18125 [Solimonas fluminis]